MTISLLDLIVAPTSEQIFQTYLTNLETLGIPAKSWQVGGAYRNILRAISLWNAAQADTIAGFAKSGFLDFAEGGWLTILAKLVYGVDRPQATFATGQELFTNSGGGVYTNVAGSVLVSCSATKKIYRTTQDLSLLTVGATQLVNIVAVEIGSASTAAPTQVDTLNTALPGVTVSNPLAIVGIDELDDDSLKSLCRNKLASLSMLGPRGAYEYAVQTSVRLDGSPVNINRRDVSANETTGVVTVTVAAPGGAPLSSDLDIIRARIEEVARPDSVTVVVAAATAVSGTRTITVWAKSTPGLDATTLQNEVELAIANMIAEYPIGGVAKPPSTAGYLYASNIEGTAKSVDPAIFAIDGAGADVALTTSQVSELAVTAIVRLV